MGIKNRYGFNQKSYVTFFQFKTLTLLQGTVHARCCHWLTAQCSIHCENSRMDEYQRNETELYCM